MNKIIKKYIENNETVDPDVYNNIKDTLYFISENNRKRKVIKETLKQLDCEMVDIQYNCVHPMKTFYPDPSGNNDNFYRCDVCGAEM